MIYTITVTFEDRRPKYYTTKNRNQALSCLSYYMDRIQPMRVTSIIEETIVKPQFFALK